jgi:hypothetical protein
MPTQNENPPNHQDFDDLVNKVCEGLRPMVTEILKRTIDGNIEPSQAIEEKIPARVEIPEVAEIPEMSANVKKILEQVQDFTYKEKINKQLHEELQKHKSGLRKEMISPLLKFIIREYDRAVQQYEFYRKKNEDEPQGELFVKLLKEFNIISLSLLDLLGDYGITPFEAQEGTDYSPSEHKIVKVIEIDVEDFDRKVADFVLCGFKDIETGRLMRQAEINIYKFSNKKS